MYATLRDRVIHLRREAGSGPALAKITGMSEACQCLLIRGTVERPKAYSFSRLGLDAEDSRPTAHGLSYRVIGPATYVQNDQRTTARRGPRPNDAPPVADQIVAALERWRIPLTLEDLADDIIPPCKVRAVIAVGQLVADGRLRMGRRPAGIVYGLGERPQ